MIKKPLREVFERRSHLLLYDPDIDKGQSGLFGSFDLLSYTRVLGVAGALMTLTAPPEIVVLP